MIKKCYSTDLGELYNCDCREFLQNYDEKLDLVITSPPYNVGIDYDSHNDEMIPEEYFAFIREVFHLVYLRLNDDGRVVINIPYECKFRHANNLRVFMVGEYWKILQEIGYNWAGIVDLQEVSPQRPKLSAWGSWLLPSAPYIYNPKECCLIVYKHQWKKKTKGTSYFDKSKKNEFIEYVSGMWKYRAETKGETKANFSLDIPTKALKILSWQEDVIYDPFMGRGTTAIACEILKRRWLGSEISTTYCEKSKELLKPYQNIETFFK